MRRQFFDGRYELLEMLQVLWVEFQIAVVSSFEPQWFILLFAKLPKLLPMREIHNFIFCSLQSPVV
jgi:hypothetical protein